MNDTTTKINQWQIARGLGDLSIDDLLSDSESTAAPEPPPITNEQLPIANYQSRRADTDRRAA